MKFIFYNGGWWEYNEDLERIENRHGGWNSYIPTSDEVVEVDSWEDLDWSCLLDSDSPIGWVSPTGDFYGCDVRAHEDVAYWVLHSSERELELKGWVKIYLDTFIHELGWYSDKLHLTSAQLHVLENKGLDIDEVFMTKWCIDWNTMGKYIQMLKEKEKEWKEMRPPLKVGNEVKIVDDGQMYTSYYQWFKENNVDLDIASRYAFENNQQINKNVLYKIVAVGYHVSDKNLKMYAIQRADCSIGGYVFLINEYGIKKA